jgi:DNA-binding transcriptional LysR family regulator
VILELKTAPSYALREQVQRGKLQAAVLTLPKGQRQAGEVLVTTTPVWVAAIHASASLTEPLALAVHAPQCPYRQVMLQALRQSGRRVRIVLESPSNQAVKACVEAGLAISLIDRGRVTKDMRILSDLPVIPDHEVVFMRSEASYTEEAIDLLGEAMQQRFRL